MEIFLHRQFKKKKKECEERTGAVKGILCLKRITKNNIDLLGSLLPNLAVGGAMGN